MVFNDAFTENDARTIRGSGNFCAKGSKETAPTYAWSKIDGLKIVSTYKASSKPRPLAATELSART